MTRLFETRDPKPRQAFAIAVAACSELWEACEKAAGKTWKRVWHRGEQSPVVNITLAAAYAAQGIYESRTEHLREHDVVEGLLRHLRFSRFSLSTTARDLADETAGDYSTCIDVISSRGTGDSWYSVPDTGMPRRVLLRMRDEMPEVAAFVEGIERVYPQILAEMLPAGFDNKGKWRAAEHQMRDILSAFEKKQGELLRRAS